jgi:hypothetical protein
VPLSVAVAESNITPLGSVPVTLKLGEGNPAAVAVKLPAFPTVKVAVLALVIVGASLTVRIKFCAGDVRSP